MKRYALLVLAVLLLAADSSLVPDTSSTVPYYFCTWNLQGFVCSYSNASDQADAMSKRERQWFDGIGAVGGGNS